MVYSPTLVDVRVLVKVSVAENINVLELSEESSLRYVFCVHLFVFSIWEYSHACQFGKVFRVGKRFGKRFGRSVGKRFGNRFGIRYR